MVHQNIKEALINKIKETSDTSILEEVANIFEFNEKDNIYKVNAEQQKAITDARSQIKKNQTLSNKQADNKANEWLNE